MKSQEASLPWNDATIQFVAISWLSHLSKETPRVSRWRKQSRRSTRTLSYLRLAPLPPKFTRADASTGLYSCLFILQVSSQRSQMQPFWVSQQHCPHSLTPACKTSMRSFSSVTHLNSIPSQFIMMYLGDGFISLFPCLIN